ncbi:uncharacterized protein LOC106866805 [Brachypodium distachyon]|uniref:Uncharacterized protein n=1 Tax=Brachypodium distachyon TaxID=15368 RepID=A0A0Q3H2E5_BRADI|nr:uncharacterized protein LOC106866805 [Brachypodium distachyon]KQJ87586.1 hypothetical protein BRADI_4g12087v3 [Brachypodium distachyon]|eukprot:XP_014758101.1 uncharacterized protein LOC106866805 [Brachypodium distachyon]
MRLFHGGPTAAARIYSRQFFSSKHGEPNPITFKNIMGLFIETFGLLLGISTILMKVALFGMAIALLIRDLSGPRYVPVMAKIMFGPVDDIEKHRPRVLKDGKWVETEPQRR